MSASRYAVPVFGHLRQLNEESFQRYAANLARWEPGVRPPTPGKPRGRWRMLTDRFFELSERLGMTQYDVADAIRASRGALNALVCHRTLGGERLPARIAEFFGVTLLDLFEEVRA